MSEKKKAERRNQNQNEKKSLKKENNNNNNEVDKRAKKKQKVSKGYQKERGRKEPTISVTKPQKHMFFNDEAESTVPITNQVTTAKQNITII